MCIRDSNCTTPTRNYNPSVPGAPTLQLRLPNGTLVGLPQLFTSSDAAGTYKLIATSQTGCSDSCSFTFSKDFSTVAPSCSAINLSCNNPSQQYTGSFSG